MKRIATPSLLLLSLTLAACGGGGGADPLAAAGSAASSAQSVAGLSGTQSVAMPGTDAGATQNASGQSTSGADILTQATGVSSANTVQTTATVPSVTTTTVAAKSGLTIDQVIADMHSPSEAMVIDPRFDWQYKPAITQYSPAGSSIPSWWTGNRPTWCYNVLTWFTALEAQGNAATNTRVQIKNLRFYVLSQSTRTWKQFDSKAAPGVDLWQYPFSYNGGSANAKNESSGGISVKPKYPYFHHGYGNSVTIVPQDVRAVYVSMEFRLVVDDPNKPDDRSKAKYVVDAGGDYWPGNGQGGWSLGYAPGMGNGRMLLATNEWRTATMLVPNWDVGAKFDEFRTNPPPLN